jgi:hypothetical protein
MRHFLIFIVLCGVVGATIDEFAAKRRYRGEVWQDFSILVYKLSREAHRWVNKIGI